MRNQSQKGLAKKLLLCKKQNLKSISPLIFDLAVEEERIALEKLIDNNSGIEIHDRIGEQLKELFKIRNPRKNLGESELDALLVDWKKVNDIDDYGVWVFYPWRNLLVHLVGEQEFIELRTSRNKYKITEEEQQDLSKKIIGVVGLSVGQSVALTMAIERSFGTIRIADFDSLELTNLNRIRRGVDSLGLPKVIMVAREIYEIDPYLNVEIFPEGLNADNIESFIRKDGLLDLVIEECDSLDIKVLVRLKSKEYSIPLVMDTSDRGMLDIERYDLEPSRPIFHGLAPESELMNLGGLSTEEKIPYVLKMVGSTTLSKRFKASMFEIKETITTWPQLASSVALGGAVSANVARRILLKKLHVSGRFFIDLEDLISDEPDNLKLEEKPKDPIEELGLGDIEKLLKSFDNNRFKDRIYLEDEIIKDLVENANTAPSGGNCQPWKWYYSDGVLHLFHDLKKSISFLDYQHRGSLLSFGAACENIQLRSKKYGYQSNIEFHYHENSPHVASIYFSEGKFENVLEERLSQTIKNRLTNRKAGNIKGLNTHVLSELKSICSDSSGYGIEIIQDQGQIEQLANIYGRMERLRILHEKSHQDLFNEIRWTDEEAYQTRNGIDINTLDLSAADAAGLSLLKDWGAIKNIKEWDLGNGFIDMTSSSVKKSSAICLFYGDGHQDKDVFDGGSVLQRIWLAANSQNVAFQPISPSTFMFYRIIKNDPIEDKFVWNEMVNINIAYNSIFQNLQSKNHLFLFRLFYAEEPKIKSYRFDLEDTLLIK